MSRVIQLSTTFSETIDGATVFSVSSTIQAQLLDAELKNLDIQFESQSSFKGDLKAFVKSVNEVGEFMAKAVKAEVKKFSQE
jgi:hypothetical protein